MDDGAKPCVFTDNDDLKWKCPHHDIDDMCYGGLRNGRCPFEGLVRKDKEHE